MKASTKLGKQILVIEDDAAISEMLVTLLEIEGYNVITADSSAAVLDLLAAPALAGGDSGPPGWSTERLPDLILLDLQLPTMDGAEMIAYLRESGQKMPPVIIVSAKPEVNVEQAAVAIGASAVILKPFPVDVLLEQIDRVLSAEQ